MIVRKVPNKVNQMKKMPSQIINKKTLLKERIKIKLCNRLTRSKRLFKNKFKCLKHMDKTLIKKLIIWRNHIKIMEKTTKSLSIPLFIVKNNS